MRLRVFVTSWQGSSQHAITPPPAEKAQFRSYEGRRRVFIIDDAEWIRHEAAYIEEVFVGMPRNVNRQLAMEGLLITA